MVDTQIIENLRVNAGYLKGLGRGLYLHSGNKEVIDRLDGAASDLRKIANLIEEGRLKGKEYE